MSNIKAPKEFVKVEPYIVGPDENLYSIMVDREKRLPNEVLFKYQVGDNYFKAYPGEFLERVKDTAKGLLELGIKKGESVSIMGRTSYDWITLDVAILSIGAITIPIYETDSADQILSIGNDSKIKFLFVENSELEIKAKSVKSQIPTLKKIYNLEQDTFQELQILGQSIPDKSLNLARTNVKADDLATIVYTSGSTGVPKGVELTHSALIGVSKNTVRWLPEVVDHLGYRFLLFLPLAHIFARFAYFAISSGKSEIDIVTGIDKLLDNLSFYKPHYTIAVPRIFEKVINAASNKAGGGVKGAIFNKATKVAIEYSKALDSETGVGPALKAKHAVYDKLLYGTIRGLFGGEMVVAISGGAPLSGNASHFFRGAGIPIIEGYGLTETGAPVVASQINYNNIGAIGFPFPGVEVKLVSETDTETGVGPGAGASAGASAGVKQVKSGELVLKTPSLLRAYHNDAKATKSVLKDGWFHTGDIAEIDENGVIKITGRTKDLIITAGGKNVSPSILEGLISQDALIEHCVLTGDRRQFIGAIITLDRDGFKAFKAKNNLANELSIEDAVNNIVVRNYLQGIIDDANLQVSRAESIRKFIVLSDQFTLENGLITTSMKIKRQKILEKYQVVIDSQIYNR
jgi:long-chain acyl-CoA synthetase